MAVQRKNRGINKPISMMVSSLKVLDQVAYIDENSKKKVLGLSV